jgi:hypothetical protein
MIESITLPFWYKFLIKTIIIAILSFEMLFSNIFMHKE